MPQPSTHYRGLRQIARIAFRRPAIGPFHDGVDLRGAQAHGVGEPAVVRIGKPGRHLSVDDGVLDLGRTSAHVPIGQQRERAGFTGTMADLAILLDDWRDVLRVGRDIPTLRRGRRRAGIFAELAAHRRRGHHRRDHHCAQCETASHRSHLRRYDSACQQGSYCMEAAAFVTGTSALSEGLRPCGLPDTLSRAPLRRRAPFAWLRSLCSLALWNHRQVDEMASRAACSARDTREVCVRIAAGIRARSGSDRQSRSSRRFRTTIHPCRPKRDSQCATEAFAEISAG